MMTISSHKYPLFLLLLLLALSSSCFAGVDELKPLLESECKKVLEEGTHQSHSKEALLKLIISKTSAALEDFDLQDKKTWTRTLNRMIHITKAERDKDQNEIYLIIKTCLNPSKSKSKFGKSCKPNDKIAGKNDHGAIDQAQAIVEHKKIKVEAPRITIPDLFSEILFDPENYEAWESTGWKAKGAGIGILSSQFTRDNTPIGDGLTLGGARAAELSKMAGKSSDEQPVVTPLN